MKQRIRRRTCPICLKGGRWFNGQCPHCGHKEDQNDPWEPWRYHGPAPRRKPSKVPHRPGRDVGDT